MNRRAQKGVVLVIALIMLVLVTLLGVVSSNSVQTNLKVVSNIEARSNLRNAAVAAFNEAIAYGELLNTSVPPFPNPCGSGGRSTCIDVTGDGVASATDDIVVELSLPNCVIVNPVLNDDLEGGLQSVDSMTCYKMPDNNTNVGIDSGGDIYSRCVDATWELAAVATDSVTGARVEVLFGFDTRATVETVAELCQGITP